MIDTVLFKKWLASRGYEGRVVGDISSRAKRADRLMEWNGEDTYLFYLEQRIAFKNLSVSVRSQLRTAVKLYQMFSNETKYTSKE